MINMPLLYRNSTMKLGQKRKLAASFVVIIFIVIAIIGVIFLLPNTLDSQDYLFEIPVEDLNNDSINAVSAPDGYSSFRTSGTSQINDFDGQEIVLFDAMSKHTIVFPFTGLDKGHIIFKMQRIETSGFFRLLDINGNTALLLTFSAANLQIEGSESGSVLNGNPDLRDITIKWTGAEIDITVDDQLFQTTLASNIDIVKSIELSGNFGISAIQVKEFEFTDPR